MDHPRATSRVFALIRDPDARAARKRSMNCVATAPIPKSGGRSRVRGRIASVSTRPGSMGLTPQEAGDLIVKMALDGDRRAFAALFGFYFPRVKAYLLRSGASPSAAEEIAQETMLRVWRKASAFDPQSGAASTWIFVIARNLRIDRLRGERGPDDLEPDPSEEPEAPPTGEMIAIMKQRGDRVREALASLSPEQAQIIRLFYFEERPHSDIARSLGLPLGTVKSRVRLAVERLRSTLEDVR